MGALWVGEETGIGCVGVLGEQCGNRPLHVVADEVVRVDREGLDHHDRQVVAASKTGIRMIKFDYRRHTGDMKIVI